jgi:hypothetical protein
MSTSATVPIPIPPPAQILTKIFTSPLDDRIAHINRVLSTASGIDSTLCFLGYGLGFVSGSLESLRNAPAFRSLLSSLSHRDVNKTGGLVAKLGDVAASAKVLGGMCSDFRMAMRLWGMLKIWAGAKATYFSPPKDGVLKILAWIQLGSMAVYLVLENNYYLWSKGVIKGMTPQTMVKRLRAAIWVFLAYLVLDFVRLGRVMQLRAAEQKEKGEDVGDKDVKTRLMDQDRAWYGSLQVDLGYFPLCFGWGGAITLPEWAYGLGGAVAGYAKFKEALRVTAT